MKVHLALALALALSSAGCLANLRGATEEADAAGESLEQAAAAMERAANATANAMANASAGTNASTAPPVARITAFAPGGALIYKSNFQAEDPKELLYVEGDSTVKLIAADSEAIAPGAKLASYAWTMNGKTIGSLAATDAKVEGAGKYAVTLTVTDSNGRIDAQTLTLAVAPKPFDVVTNLTSAQIAGAEGAGQGAKLTYTLALADAKVPAKIVKLVVSAGPPQTCDIALTVTGPDGEIGSSTGGSLGEAETVESAADATLTEGAYEIDLAPSACFAQEGVPVTVTVTFLPVVEGIDAGDGHGAHAHCDALASYLGRAGLISPRPRGAAG